MSKANDFSQLTRALLDKTLSKEELLKKVQQDFSLIDFLVEGVGALGAGFGGGDDPFPVDPDPDHDLASFLDVILGLGQG